MKKTLQEYGFTVWDLSDYFITYSKDVDYETVFIRINFKYQTIEIYAIDEDGKFKEVDDGIHVDVIKVVIEILESGKIEIDFRGETNVKK